MAKVSIVVRQSAGPCQRNYMKINKLTFSLVHFITKMKYFSLASERRSTDWNKLHRRKISVHPCPDTNYQQMYKSATKTETTAYYFIKQAMFVLGAAAVAPIHTREVWPINQHSIRPIISAIFSNKTNKVIFTSLLSFTFLRRGHRCAVSFTGTAEFEGKW